MAYALTYTNEATNAQAEDTIAIDAISLTRTNSRHPRAKRDGKREECCADDEISLFPFLCELRFVHVSIEWSCSCAPHSLPRLHRQLLLVHHAVPVFRSRRICVPRRHPQLATLSCLSCRSRSPLPTHDP
jgi:hypothetical protein